MFLELGSALGIDIHGALQSIWLLGGLSFPFHSLVGLARDYSSTLSFNFLFTWNLSVFGMNSEY